MNSRVRRLGASVVRIVIIASLALALYVRVFERNLIYFPDREFVGVPSLPFEDVSFKAADGISLHGWFIPYEKSEDVLIVSHGNAGNISYRAEMGMFLHEEFRTSVFMYDYRGYGKSEGTPSEEGTYSDIRGAYQHVQSRGYRPTSIYLLGQSLGTAVVIDLAANHPVAGILLEAPFTSIRAVVREVFHLPIGSLLRTRYDSLAKIGQIRAPLVMVHARADPVLPYKLAVELFEAANSPKRFVDVDGPLHEGALMGLGVARTRELRDFLFKQLHQ